MTQGRLPVWLFSSLLLLLAAHVAHGQGTTSRLVGTVTDTSGAVVRGATVTLLNQGTGGKFMTVTTEAGTYVFEAVQVGVYTVSIELQGFKKVLAAGHRVVIGEPSTVNLTLEPGAVAESVEVTAQPETVQVSTSGNIGTNYEQRAIESLPIVGTRGRNVLDLVLSQPGVVSGGNISGVHVHGARDRAWNYTLDGIDNNETSAGGGSFSPTRTNPDSLAEFQVITGNMTAENGRNSGGQVAMVTRSGSNIISGTLFYFDRRPEYNANEWENKLNGLPKRDFTQKISGFSVGGPIRRNRTFFFANTQWLRATQTQRVTRTVLTPLARAGVWRYVVGGRNTPANAPGASVDPDGNVAGGVAIGTYDIGMNDPQRRGLDPTILAILQSAPPPNNYTVGDGLNLAGFTWTPAEEEEQHDFVAKIDHLFNARHAAFIRIAEGQQNTNCNSVATGLAVFPGGGCAVNTQRSPYNWAANWRSNPRFTVVNELVVGKNHAAFDFVNPATDATKPTFSLPLSLSNPEQHGVGNLRSTDVLQLVDNLSIVSGPHSFKFGTNLRLQLASDARGTVAGFSVSPAANFSTTISSVDPTLFGLPPNINTTNDLPSLQSAVNLLLGRVGQIGQGFVQSGGGYAPGGTRFDFDANFNELDFYAQDSWKLRPNLTVDLGVRWEIRMAPTNSDNLIRRPNQRVAAGEPASNTLSWVVDDLYKSDVNNVGPSIGVAWDPRGDSRSVVRANYRLAYDRVNTFPLSALVFQSIPGITTGVANTAFGTGGGRLRDGLPRLEPTATPDSFLQPPPVSSASISVVDSALETPSTHGWLLSYQRDLWSRGTLEVSYIGRRAQHLYGAYNANQVEIRANGFLDAFNLVKSGGESGLINQLLAADTRRLATETGSQMMRRLFPAELNLNSVAAVASALGTRVQGGRTLPDVAGLSPFFFFPYPQFLGGVTVLDSNDWSRYHALEVRLSKRFSSGYSYQLAYTLARSKDTRSFDPVFTVVGTADAQTASSTPFDIFNRGLNFAPSDFDRTHVFQGQWVLELPFGRGRRWDAGRWADAVIGGWQVAGQVLVVSGRPFTIYSGANTMSNVVQTPAHCNGCDGSEGDVYRETDGIVWYLTPEERGKFAAPAAGEFSNVGRNAFRGPGGYSMSLSLGKRIAIAHGQFLEVRADATNVTNVTTFGLPTATTTSTVFGRIRDTVVSSARQVMLGVKFTF
jgi:hypothetical protein